MQNEVIRADAAEATSMGNPAVGEQSTDQLVNPYAGIAAEPFTKEQVDILLDKVPEEDIEIRPDGLIYLPEIRYRRVLNRTFGPGAWALLPRSIDIQDNMLYYRGALFVHGRFVSEAIGEQQYFVGNDRMSYATAAEAAKSNCLVRCCKDLGIASELWDPSFIRSWLARNAMEVWCTSRQDGAKRKKFWRKRSAGPIDMWPWIENETTSGNALATEFEGELFPRGRNADAPAQPRGGDQSSGAHSGAPAPADRRLISTRQAARFRAIAREYGWSEADAQKLLSRYGFAGPDEITRAAYDEICHRLENPQGAADFLAAA
jgi:hypothetical protein